MNRTWRNIGLGLVASGAAAAFWAFVVEPRWLRLTRTTLHFAELPQPLEGLRIALLTDLHAGPATPADFVPRLVRMTMAARPHVIAITGDLADDEASLRRTLNALASLSAPFGVYVVPGNHDYRDIGIQRWHDALSVHPSLMDLTNRARIVNVRADGRPDDVAHLCIAGVDDLSHGRPHLRRLPPAHRRDFTVLLAHQPDQAEHVRRGEDDIDLVVSGHTHGGQVRLPGIGAVVNSAVHPELYEAGVRRRPWTQVYTSRGIGTVHLPVRFLNRPEVALLTLTAEPRPGRGRTRRQTAPGDGHRPVS